MLGCKPSTNEFDASDFERAAEFPMPAGARVLKGETRTWDAQGDHDACAVVEISQVDYDRIRSAVLKNPSVGERPSLIACSQDMYAEFSRYAVDVRQHASKEGGLVRELMLVKSQPIVLLQVSSW